MTELFLSVFNMSVAAGWMVLAVLVLRLLLRRAPKWVNVLLWGLVAFRIICPFTVESALSLIPSTETVSPNIMLDTAPGITSGIPVIDDAVNTVIEQTFTPAPEFSANPLQVWLPIISVVWIAGIAVLLMYTVVSFVRLRLRVREAVLYRDNIYQSERVRSAFVLGVRKPRIYLPYQMSEQDMHHVIAHEQVHIRRRDHWWKPLGFLLLSIHWFNPILWLAYVLFCRDIELACDERVIRRLPMEERADYSQALLSCSINRRSIAACPLAFGETGIKKRIISVLQYKKPAVVVTVTAVILCVLVAACFLTNPTLQSGIGVQSIRVAEHDSKTFLQLDYLFMPQSGFHSRTVFADEGEYTADGMVEYDGALGEYRMIIEFADIKPTVGFRKSYPAGQVFDFENIPQRYKGNLKFKVVYPQEHSFVIYIGSDRPIIYKEPALYNVRYLGGTLEFRLFNTADPEPDPAEQGPLPGLYEPLKQIYINPDYTDETAERLGDFKFEIGNGQFSVKMASDMVWETDHNASTYWNDADALPLFDFARGTEIYPEISQRALRACNINSKYILVQSTSMGDVPLYLGGESLYLFYYGDNGLYAVYLVELVN